MPKYIEGILEAEVEYMIGITEIPAANHLFSVQEYGGTLTRVQENSLLNTKYRNVSPLSLS